MVNDDVLAANRGKSIAIMFQHPFGVARVIRNEFEFRAVLLDHFGKPGNAQHAFSCGDKGLA